MVPLGATFQNRLNRVGQLSRMAWPRALPVLTGNSTDMTLVVGGGGSGGQAVFDAELNAPRCLTPASSCDTGHQLVRRRGALGEPNQPNTIRASCADGSSPVSPTNGSNDRIRIVTGDGLPFAPGKTVRVDATVEARADFAADAADFFYAADATDPVWVLADTVVPFKGRKADDRATGFHIMQHTAKSVASAVQGAVDVFHDRTVWNELIDNGMSADVSWAHSAKQYEQRFASLVQSSVH